MVFSSAVFLFFFLPIVLLAYYCLPGVRAKNSLLLLASLVFYFWGEKWLVFYLVGVAVFNYVFGLLIAGAHRGFIGNHRNAEQKFFFALALCANLAFLGYFKYYHFALDTAVQVCDFFNLKSFSTHGIGKVAIPIGVSFYTFQAMSYNSGAPNDLSVLMCFSSFSGPLSPFMNQTFTKVHYASWGSAESQEFVTIVKKAKPDVVIWETTERYLNSVPQTEALLHEIKRERERK